MGDDEITPSLEAAYAVETPDENRRLYAEWASSYEETFVAAKLDAHSTALRRMGVEL